MAARKTRKDRAQEEHEFAMADLQDAVDQTGDGSEGDGETGWKENLRRARDREQAAHDELSRSGPRSRKARERR